MDTSPVVGYIEMRVSDEGNVSRRTEIGILIDSLLYVITSFVSAFESVEIDKIQRGIEFFRDICSRILIEMP